MVQDVLAGIFLQVGRGRGDESFGLELVRVGEEAHEGFLVVGFVGKIREDDDPRFHHLHGTYTANGHQGEEKDEMSHGIHGFGAAGSWQQRLGMK